MEYCKFDGWDSPSPYKYTKREDNPNRRKHHRDTRLYHGPIHIPEQVMEQANKGRVLQDTCRHLVLRVAWEGMVWVFRDFAGPSRPVLIGEIVRTAKGEHRVHLWQVVDRDGVDPFLVIDREKAEAAADAEPLSAGLPLVPPLKPAPFVQALETTP